MVQRHDPPAFAVAGFWQQTATGRGCTMVTCDLNELVAPIHPKAMITILGPSDVDPGLRGSYEDIVHLQRPCDAARISVSGPVFPTRHLRSRAYPSAPDA